MRVIDPCIRWRPGGPVTVPLHPLRTQTAELLPGGRHAGRAAPPPALAPGKRRQAKRGYKKNCSVTYVSHLEVAPAGSRQEISLQGAFCYYKGCTTRVRHDAGPDGQAETRDDR